MESWHSNDDFGMECHLMGLMGCHAEELDGCKMLKVFARVNGTPILVLIDSGASHNFVALQVVTMLGLKVEPSRKFSVKLGDGHRVKTTGQWVYHCILEVLTCQWMRILWIWEVLTPY